MIKILFFLTLCTTSLWARVHLELTFNESAIKQGQIAPGKFIVKEGSGASALSGLKGKKLGKVLYIQNVSPFMGKQGQLESEVKIIFIKVPESNSITEVLNGEETLVTWNGVEIIPTEEAKSFIFGDFEIPEKLKLFPWLIGLIGLILTLFIVFWFKKKLTNKASLKAKRNRLKQEILTAASYDDIVFMWRQKLRYLETFPEIEDQFKNFEKVLFKYQFKQQRTDKEIADVETAYLKFKTEVAGVLNGI